MKFKLKANINQNCSIPIPTEKVNIQLIYLFVSIFDFFPPAHGHTYTIHLHLFLCESVKEKFCIGKALPNEWKLRLCWKCLRKGERKWSSAKWEIYVLEEESGKKNIKNQQQQQHSTYKCQNRYYVNISRHIIVCINTLSYINMMLWISYFIRFE